MESLVYKNLKLKINDKHKMFKLITKIDKKQIFI